MKNYNSLQIFYAINFSESKVLALTKSCIFMEYFKNNNLRTIKLNL